MELKAESKSVEDKDDNLQKLVTITDQLATVETEGTKKLPNLKPSNKDNANSKDIKLDFRDKKQQSLLQDVTRIIQDQSERQDPVATSHEPTQTYATSTPAVPYYYRSAATTTLQ